MGEIKDVRSHNDSYITHVACLQCHASCSSPVTFLGGLRDTFFTTFSLTSPGDEALILGDVLVVVGLLQELDHVLSLGRKHPLDYLEAGWKFYAGQSFKIQTTS